MNKVSWKKTLAAAALTTALVGGGSTAASAITWYPPGTNIWISANKAAPRTYVVTVNGGVFTPGKTVVIKIPKLFGAKFGAIVPDTDSTWTVVANAEGGVDPFTIAVPEEIEGTFTLTAETDTEAVTSTFSITPDSIVTAVADSTAGVDGVAIGLWVMGGAVGVAGIALAGSSLSRRRADGLAV